MSRFEKVCRSGTEEQEMNRSYTLAKLRDTRYLPLPPWYTASALSPRLLPESPVIQTRQRGAIMIKGVKRLQCAYESTVNCKARCTSGASGRIIIWENLETRTRPVLGKRYAKRGCQNCGLPMRLSKID
jgi:hypothetical protein